MVGGLEVWEYIPQGPRAIEAVQPYGPWEYEGVAGPKRPTPFTRVGSDLNSRLVSPTSPSCATLPGPLYVISPQGPLPSHRITPLPDRARIPMQDLLIPAYDQHRIKITLT
jgi:hypothetical protein